MDKSKFNEKKEWRKFGIGLTSILCIMATIQLCTGRSHYPCFYGAGIFILIISLSIPILLKPIFILFSYIGLVLGWVMTRLILSVLFYAIITPMSLISRLLGKSYLDLKIDQKRESYWVDKPNNNRVYHYENQY